MPIIATSESVRMLGFRLQSISSHSNELMTIRHFFSPLHGNESTYLCCLDHLDLFAQGVIGITEGYGNYPNFRQFETEKYIL